ncbi:MAG TPA: AmmeMemoRadiSam system protein B [Desulfobacteraceae bacterium]|nr:AmmeMemoRadiSam system protein B [Desulfobacteraceae bacterium]HPJ68285.1 AmmeMemoRadiSam system protein B [Desulfobacteraceae bacterium]HPQ29229.1 AmmeMemoRadiSam system protein B [Desulfobacteraceae bacterium]
MFHERLLIPFFQILLTLCIFFTAVGEVCSKDIRRAVWAGSFYPAARSELEKMIDRLTLQAKKADIDIPSNKPLKALILPHAGYIYSGLTAAHSSLVLKENQFKKVILLGPDHRVGFTDCAITNAEAYESPLGLIKLHADAAKLRINREMFRYIPASDKSEHSIEVLLPFLQRYLGRFEIVPVVTGYGDAERISDALNDVVDKDTLLVVSSDLSHFLSYEDCVLMDRETIDMILNLEIDKISASINRACGKIPVSVLLNIAASRRWKSVLLHFCNSGDITGDKGRVVGYAAIAFYGSDSGYDNRISGTRFNQAQGQALLKLARKAIMEKFGMKLSKSDEYELETALTDSIFKTCRGTFVTLTIDRKLRGCIGNLEPKVSILDGIRDNAVKAAFSDFRFAPLTANELERVDIEISILNRPLPLEYLDSNDLLAKLRPSIDGVIIRKGASAATFLPQVWGQLPEPEGFLSHLCMKAGMPSDAWRNSGLEVLTYQVQYFEEK